MSDALSNVVMRALDRNVDQRFPSCAQFADALEAAATGNESIATPRELAAYVTEVLGDEVSAQREAVRAWIARSEPSQVDAAKPGTVPSTSVSAAAMSLPGLDAAQAAALTQNTSPKGRSPAWLFVLVTLLLFVVGGGSFMFARQTSPNRGLPAATALPAAAAVPSAAPLATARPTRPSSPSAPSALPPVAGVPTPPKPPTVWQRPRGASVDTNAKKAKKKGGDDVIPPNPYR